MKKPEKMIHRENDARLARIEGQIRGIRRMIEQGEYCIEIINQIEAARSALGAVSTRILRKHLESCVVDSFRSESQTQIDEKIDEVMKVLKRIAT